MEVRKIKLTWPLVILINPYSFLCDVLTSGTHTTHSQEDVVHQKVSSKHLECKSNILMNCTYNYPYQMVDQVAHKSTEISIFRPCYNLSPTKFSCSGCLHCSKKYPFIPYTVSHIMKSCLLGHRKMLPGFL